MYLILSSNSEAYADALSGKLFQLSRPDHVRDPADVTTHWVGWDVVHSDGRRALYFEDGDLMYVHPESNENDLPDNIQDLTAQERGDLKLAIKGKKGKRESPLNLLPAKFTANLRTQEQMEADGWFSDIVIP